MGRLLLLVVLAAVYSPGAKAACTLDSFNSDLPSVVARSVSDGQSIGTVTIIDSNVVCLATSTNRGEYREASVVVNCTGTGCPAGLLQVDVECPSGTWNPTRNRNNSVADLTTPLRTDCALCNGDAAGILSERLDNVTNCVACSPSCNTGLMECTGDTDNDCCTGVVNNMCVASCPAPQRPLSSANFTCTEFCDSLPDPMSGSIDFSDGNMINSTANYSCNENFTLQGNTTRMCQSNSTSTFWTGDAPTCIADATDTPATTICPEDGKTTDPSATMSPGVGVTTEAPPTCDGLVASSNQVISYTSSCTIEINCQAQYSCMDNYELMGGASLRTCSLPKDMVPVWSGVAPRCEQRSNALTQAEIAGIGIGVAVVVAAVLIAIVVIVIVVLSRAS